MAFATGLGRRTVARKWLYGSVSCLALAAAVIPGSAFAQDGDENAQADEKIIVTGSYVARPDQSTLSSPVQILGEEEIQRSGFVGVDDLLLLNTANIGSIGGTQDLAGGGADDRATRSANLRGLGPSSTLVLLNNRRVASTDGYTNLVALTPTIAVKRVETVLDGASALYGSDAIAGVINILTDENFEGARFSTQYTDIEDAPGYIFQGMVGGGSDTFHAVFSASYEFQDNLQNRHRDVTNFDNTSGLAQPGNYILNTRPVAAGGGDVIIDNGVNGPINYSQLYDDIFAANGGGAVQFADPHCTVDGTGGIYAGGNPFPNGACRFSYQQRNPIRPKSKVTLLHGDIRYDVTPEHQLFAEARYYHQDTQRIGIGSFPITTGTLIVPGENPFNPFGVDATFAGRLLGSNAPDRVEEVSIDGFHLVTGLQGPLPFLDNWNYQISGVYSSEDRLLRSSDTDMILAQNALNGFGGADCQIGPNGVPAASEVAGEGACYFFSPFGKDQLTNDPATAYNTLSPFFRGFESEIKYIEGVVTGDIFELPGGTAGMAIGAQVRDEFESVDLDSGIVNARFGFNGKSLPGEGNRTVRSIFTEFYLPFLDTLDAQLAVRFEDYGQFQTTDPKLGINWRPLDSLSFRGSVSTAFRAPDIGDAVSNSVTSAVGQTVDPLDPTDTGTFRVIRTVSNPDLKPEQSTNYNIGATWEPISNFRLSADYWAFDFTDQVTLEAAQQVIDADPNGPAIVRDEFDRLISVDVGYFNAGSTKTNGIDLRADYVFAMGDHTFRLNNMLTYIITYEVQLGPDAPVIDALGGRNARNPGAPAPQFRNNFSLGWDWNAHSANFFLRHTDGVSDDLSGGGVDAWTVYDAQYSYRFGGETQYSLTVGALNITDEAPPAAAFTGYLPSIHDALGRQAYVRLSLQR